MKNILMEKNIMVSFTIIIEMVMVFMIGLQILL